jgi:hypothetical protein
VKRICKTSKLAFTRVGLLVVLGIFAVFLTAFYAWAAKAKARAIRYSCINNVKQCALSFMVWSGDHNDRFPMEVSNTLGGTLELVPEGNAFRHFQVMSNELSTPIVVWCPADTRRDATNFTHFQNENVSFFVGLDASKSNRQAWLCGDRNLTNGLALNHTTMKLESGQSAGWTKELHDRCGNVALADGSVQKISNVELRNTLKNAAGLTNRLALPE